MQGDGDGGGGGIKSEQQHADSLRPTGAVTAHRRCRPPALLPSPYARTGAIRTHVTTRRGGTPVARSSTGMVVDRAHRRGARRRRLPRLPGRGDRPRLPRQGPPRSVRRRVTRSRTPDEQGEEEGVHRAARRVRHRRCGSSTRCDAKRVWLVGADEQGHPDVRGRAELGEPALRARTRSPRDAERRRLGRGAGRARGASSTRSTASSFGFSAAHWTARRPTRGAEEDRRRPEKRADGDAMWAFAPLGQGRRRPLTVAGHDPGSSPPGAGRVATPRHAPGRPSARPARPRHRGPRPRHAAPRRSPAVGSRRRSPPHRTPAAPSSTAAGSSCRHHGASWLLGRHGCLLGSWGGERS